MNNLSDNAKLGIGTILAAILLVGVTALAPIKKEPKPLVAGDVKAQCMEVNSGR